ncbi:lyso-ornithine lipid acyltransferase [Moraxella catarrhalis 12P80B1]|nr:lyso-ornithine lipid acyltransferase [Moraxella catarrhalis 12P80B1]
MSNFISNQYYRTKAAFGLTNTLLNGFQMLYESKAYRSDVPRNRLMPYVQKFCQKNGKFIWCNCDSN